MEDMKVKPFSILLLLSLFSTGNLFAQTYTDLLRYSQKFYQGTARSAASGNAFGAVGADFGAISINPASLGLYRRPEFTFGFGFNQQSAEGNYLGNTAHDDKYNLNMSNLGLVLADVRYKLGKPVQEGWVSVNFGIGYNRTNNFHNNIAIEGHNKQSSILHSWREEAQGRTYGSLNEFSYPFLGAQVGLVQTIDPDPSATEWEDITSREDSSGLSIFQGDYLSTRGSMNDINFSVAGNYSNKVYVGANISVPTIGYHSTRLFTETNDAGANAVIYNGMQISENVNTSGLGITAGFGAIYRASDAIRLGASLQLPTFYSMYDKYTTDIVGYRKDATYEYATPAGSYEYSIVTPMRANFSSAVLFGKNGFISADFEWVDYTSARINTASDNARIQNERVRQIYRSTGNIRLGGEYRIENFALRGGYELHSSPFQSKFVPDKYNGATNIIAAGIGMRDADYYFDFTYQYIQSNSFYLLYTLQNQDVAGANIKSTRNNFMITVGSKF
ncbi:MAG: OmpP1/FadL family transporter [Bacteroidia bacterium]